MADPLRIFPDEFVPNEQSSTNHKKWVQANPKEAAKWAAFRDAVLAYEADDATIPIPSMATAHGKALVAAGRLHVSVTDIGAEYNPIPEEPPPPPPGGGLTNPYFNETFVNISNPEWDTVQTYAGAGGFNPGPSPGVQSDSTGRLSLVTAPDGVGRALRFEIQNADPRWDAQSPDVHRCQLGAPTASIWNASTMTLGDVRWFDFELWIPTEFDWARNDWNALIGIHPSGSSGWGAFNIVVEGHAGNNNAFIDFKLGGGSPPGTTANLVYYPLIRLTNADGTVYTPNRNRRVHLRYGGKFNPDNTGWAEAWVDGVNVLPRISRPTCWADDFNQYMKLGPYKLRSSPYPSGRTVIYVTRAQIGMNP